VRLNVGVEHYNEPFYMAFRSQIYVCEVVAGDAPAVVPLERTDGGADDSDVLDHEKLLPPCETGGAAAWGGGDKVFFFEI
jgi:hypothetical protein